MFKSKITRKLSLYFAIALLIFAIIIGSVFIILFKNQSLKTYKIDLEDQATNIAQTISMYMDDNNTSMGGFGMYLRVIGDLSKTDVWIVDKELNLITGRRGRGNVAKDYKYADLPENADKLIKEGLRGNTVFSEDFTNILSQNTLSVSRPIMDKGDNVIGIVLLHSPIEGINEAISQGILILISSILLALILSFLLSIIFSISFTKPLETMKKTAKSLAEGDYTVKTNIEQDDEIGQLAKTIDILSDRLHIASKESGKLEDMRREFVANISHELKTPITVIRGSLEALVDKVVTNPTQVEDYYIQMLKESKYLQRLVADLLDLSKLQSMDFEIKKTTILISSIIEDVIRSGKHLAEKKGVSIKLTKEIDDFELIGDYGRIRQMIMIILDNSIKFSPKNSTVNIVIDKGSFYIKDNGIGISKEDMPYIFERFYKSRSEDNKIGTGLGLAIAKNIADRHDIQLRVESREGQGSSFIFIWNSKSSQKEQSKDIIST